MHAVASALTIATFAFGAYGAVALLPPANASSAPIASVPAPTASGPIVPTPLFPANSTFPNSTFPNPTNPVSSAPEPSASSESPWESVANFDVFPTEECYFSQVPMKIHNYTVDKCLPFFGKVRALKIEELEPSCVVYAYELWDCEGPSQSFSDLDTCFGSSNVLFGWKSFKVEC